ncbi:hypothetical protein FB451DRAFT_785509 [Mycena latifolia]|nr:hypothetical protein FB451DRAFT_785509 [Mycena latifolia]
MSTILDVPPELIFRILELTVNTYDIRRYCQPEREYAHLRNTALVRKTWAAPSQMLLWRYVRLRDVPHTVRWINSPAARRYTTLGLSIHDGRRWTAAVNDPGDPILKLVLSKTVGLQTLEIVFFELISAECLALPELKDLTALAVSNSTILEEGESGFAFRLKFFKTLHTNIHPAVVEALFRRSADTLERLELEQQHAQGSQTLPGLAEGFPLVAANIRTLRITDTYGFIVPFLGACTALKRLELTFELHAEFATGILKALPTPLDDLYVEAALASGGLRVAEAVVRLHDYPSLLRLGRLHLKEDVITDLLEVPGSQAEELHAALKAHNITVLAVSSLFHRCPLHLTAAFLLQIPDPLNTSRRPRLGNPRMVMIPMPIDMSSSYARHRSLLPFVDPSYM